MTKKIGILFLSSNPKPTGRILVDEEAREISEKLEEGPYRNRFELHKHVAVRPTDLQRLLLKYQPQIVHFSGHGSKHQRSSLVDRTAGIRQSINRVWPMCSLCTVIMCV